MSRAAFTLKVFGTYLLFFGTSLIVIPNLMFSVFGFPQTTEVWIRVVGTLAIVIGIYQWNAARSEAKVVMQGSVYARVFVFLAFVAFVLLGFVKPCSSCSAALTLRAESGRTWPFAAKASAPPVTRGWGKA
jgi:hypothetical protein